MGWMLEREQEAKWLPLAFPEPDHRILGLVVHGIGEQKIGGTLRDVVAQLLPLIRQTGVDPEASVTVKPLDEGDPAEAVFRFTDMRSGSTKTYEVRVREVWWAQTFRPPSFGKFARGARRVLCKWRPGGVRWTDPVYWQRTIVDGVLFVLRVPIAVILAVLAVVEAGQVVLDALPWWIKKPHRILVNISTRQAGDALVYMQDSWDASRGRARFEQRFYELTEWIHDGDRGGNTLTERYGAESMFIVGHSLGAVVAYEAMTGTRMGKHITKKFRAGRPNLWFFSVGSALNTAWEFSDEQEKHRFRRELPKEVNWVDFYSLHDPVARGALCPPKDLQISACPCEVHNQMDVFSDHQAYFDNAEQVMAPILTFVTPKEFSILLDGKGRKGRVQWLSAVKALAYIAAIPVGLTFWLYGWGDWTADWLRNVDQLQEAPWKWIISEVMVCIVSAILAPVALYSLAFKSLWNSRDRKAKYETM